jgi:hypothetical protein
MNRPSAGGIRPLVPEITRCLVAYLKSPGAKA